MSRLRVVGSTVTGTATASLPSGWYPGDLVLVVAYSASGGSIPSLASGYTSIGTGSANNARARVGYRQLSGSETDAGTWTNATSCRSLLIRGASPTAYVNGIVSSYSLETQTKYPALGSAGSDSDKFYVMIPWDIGTATPSPVTASYLSSGAGFYHVAGPVTDWTEHVTDTDGGASWQYISGTIAINSGSFPFINDLGISWGTTLSGGVSLTMPATIAAGDLLLAFCTNDNPGATNMAISGWTEIYQETVGSNAHRIACFAKIAVGGDTATLTGASEDYTATIKAIKRHGVSSLTAHINKATAATGNSTTPDAPQLSGLDTENWLWLAHFGIDSSNTTVSNWAPTNFTAQGKLTSAASTTASTRSPESNRPPLLCPIRRRSSRFRGTPTCQWEPPRRERSARL